MGLTEHNEREMRSRESYSLSTPGNLLFMAAISMTATAPVMYSAPHPRVHERFSESSFQGTVITLESIENKRSPAPANAMLAERLRKLRSQAINKGMPLLDSDEISLELQKRRGEIG